MGCNSFELPVKDAKVIFEPAKKIEFIGYRNMEREPELFGYMEKGLCFK